MAKVYEVKKRMQDCLGVCKKSVGFYATCEIAEEVAAKKEADELHDEYVRITYEVIEHEVKGTIDD